MKQEVTFDIPLLSAIDQINVKAYYTGRTKSAEADPTAVISDIVDADNAYIVISSINKAIGNLQSVLGEYAPNSITRTGTELEPSVNVSITLASNFDSSATTALKETLAKYCENMVLYDWFAITTPTDAEFYAQQMVLAVADIRTLLRRRIRPTRKTTPI